MNVDLRRNLPKINNITLRKSNSNSKSVVNKHVGRLYLFIDEFTNYYDLNVGLSAFNLLVGLGYKVEIVNHLESGRAFISNGFLRKARKIADNNVNTFYDLISEDVPLVGIEPSAILSFRDEYPELVSIELREKVLSLKPFVYTVEEFIVREFNCKRIVSESFTNNTAQVSFHGHCFQKSLTTTQSVRDMLSIPTNYTVSEFKTGCCGMAGFFGYEKKNYDLSMQIGELALFPQVRIANNETILAASGTSCRHHIEFGTKRKVKHPVEVLYEAMI